MLIAQLIDPAELVELSPRQYEVLESTVLAELISSPALREALTERANATLNAIRERKPRKDFE
jgi:hypothetical protein